MTSYLNTYKAPESTVDPDVHKDTPVEQYDLNYAFEVKPLKSDRVELRPYVVCQTKAREGPSAN